MIDLLFICNAIVISFNKFKVALNSVILSLKAISPNKSKIVY